MSKAQTPLELVKNVDLQRYTGKWYEIIRLPNSFEKGLECITATYTLKSNGKIEVFNQGLKISSQKWSNIKGFAKIPDPEQPAKLRVTFFWPFFGDYQIIALDDNYQYALVGSPNRKYLWILSRTPQLDENIIQKLLATAQKQGFDVTPIIRTPQCK
jgi:lipocalin